MRRPFFVTGGYESLKWPRNEPRCPIARGLSRALSALRQGQAVKGFLTLRPACESLRARLRLCRCRRRSGGVRHLARRRLVVIAALITEVVYQPPYWVHAALWLPLILLVTLGPLRPIKGLMIALQYHHKAAEGRSRHRSDA